MSNSAQSNSAQTKSAEPTLKDLASHRKAKLENSMHDMQDAIRDKSAVLMEDTIDVVKKYPLTTALGAAAVGFVAGLIFIRRK